MFTELNRGSSQSIFGMKTSLPSMQQADRDSSLPEVEREVGNRSPSSDPVDDTMDYDLGSPLPEDVDYDLGSPPESRFITPNFDITYDLGSPPPSEPDDDYYDLGSPPLPQPDDNSVSLSKPNPPLNPDALDPVPDAEYDFECPPHCAALNAFLPPRRMVYPNNREYRVPVLPVMPEFHKKPKPGFIYKEQVCHTATVSRDNRRYLLFEYPPHEAFRDTAEEYLPDRIRVRQRMLIKSRRDLLSSRE
ncbi:hypothetical protein A0H81_11422 [Grifola frondosa]|uniref:Uncharacterized protein n=1 Tax=Grifola frondosa TaxID=5627 RepID=A0A1C7LUM4_GRIFR|nr:hypothetical protein A0H81_11422 [Grifola frondosa]